MYNHYVPGHDGIYHRQTIADKPRSIENEEPAPSACFDEPPKERTQGIACCTQQSGMDLGDILLFCIIALLVIDCDEEDSLPLLIMAAALLLLK